jgi:flagellar protein FliJ
MKKFEFKLEKVLGIRKFQQEQAEIELGKALSAEQTIQNKLDLLAMQHTAVVRQLDGCTDFNEISSAQLFFKFLDIQKEQLCNDMVKAKLITEQKRTLLRTAMQKCASVSKLRERQLQSYGQDVAREEESITDDIVTSHFRNK